MSNSSHELTASPTESIAEGSKKSSGTEQKPRRPPSLYEYITFGMFTLGVIAFTRTGDYTLLYLAGGMVAAEAGVPIVDSLKEFFRRGGPGKPGP